MKGEGKMKLNAEWISYMKAYRLYNPKHPQDTVAYKNDLGDEEKRAKKEGYDGIVICDADTMHTECY